MVNNLLTDGAIEQVQEVTSEYQAKRHQPIKQFPARKPSCLAVEIAGHTLLHRNDLSRNLSGKLITGQRFPFLFK